MLCVCLIAIIAGNCYCTNVCIVLSQTFASTFYICCTGCHYEAATWFACLIYCVPPEGAVRQFIYLFWLSSVLCIFLIHFYLKTIKRMMLVKNKLKIYNWIHCKALMFKTQYTQYPVNPLYDHIVKSIL